MRITDRTKPEFAPFRSGRLFRTDAGWYVDTREGLRGPFPVKELAIQDKNNLVGRLAQM